ncbi:hypothetical protein [Halobacteriovorax sp.]|uniref:hypothetical protein n=1 Tax=Halobacteriovorax sp. TaxID=2020862 RepID=UPI00356B389D
MKKLIFGMLLLVSSAVSADVYLDYGESTTVGRTSVYCGMSRPQVTYYCTIDSTFDGIFSGTGSSELEARTNAINACKYGGRGNGVHCSVNSIECDSN